MNYLLQKGRRHNYIVFLLLPVFLLYQMSFYFEYTGKININPKSDFNNINDPVHIYVPEEGSLAFLVVATNNRNITSPQRYFFPGYYVILPLFVCGWKTFISEFYLFLYIIRKSAFSVWILGGHSPPALTII